MSTVTCNGCEPKASPEKVATVGEKFDESIARARAHVEELCVLKAKAECLGILDHPAEFYGRLYFTF